MLMNNDEYFDMLTQIKHDISRSRYRAVLNANREMVVMYWQVGEAVNTHSKWGNKFIDTLSKDIRAAFPGIKGFSARNLKYMAKFAREFELEFVQQVVAQIPWGHITRLLDKADDLLQRSWYIEQTIENGWSRSILEHQIDTDLYGRQVLSDKVTNFSQLAPAFDSDLVQQTLKDPYVFDFINTAKPLAESELEAAMVENVSSLLLELGTGFAFVGRQYPVQVSNQDYYLDLLFYNIKLKCYVVVELKATSFKPEYAGKLNFYLSAVDDLLCDDADNPSIGLLLCKGKDKVVAEYSLRDISKPIGVSEYRLADVLPENFADRLPSSEDLEKRI